MWRNNKQKTKKSGVVKIKQKVLVVDDEDNIRMLVRFNLEKAGYEVFEAEDGRKAVEIAVDLTPDIVLLDLMYAAI